MVFELPSQLYFKYDKYNGNGQSALLQALSTSIQNTYPTSSIGADGQVIVISFNDGVKFEIVPVFVNQTDSYTYPDSNNGGAWKVTNPRPEIEAIKNRNRLCNKNLIPLCRMMRAWKVKWEVPISGLLIDTLAYQFLENYEHRDKTYIYYDFMCSDFFKWMSNQSSEQAYWKAPGSGQYVYGKGLFQYKATRCYNISLEAIAHEMAESKREYSAKLKWREIFGTTFPS